MKQAEQDLIEGLTLKLKLDNRYVPLLLMENKSFPDFHNLDMKQEQKKFEELFKIKDFGKYRRYKNDV